MTRIAELARHVERHYFVPLVMLACLVISTPPAHAGTGERISIPNSAVRAVNGIRLTIDCYWVEGHGYRPVRFVATADQPMSFDRKITIQFRADNDDWRNSQIDMIARQDFLIPADAIEGRATIAVPQYRPWGRISWDVFIDDRLARELLIEGYMGPSQMGSWNDASPRSLVVSRAATPRKTSMAPRPPAAGNRRTGSTMMRSTSSIMVDTTGTAIRLTPTELPERWIDYSCLDIIYIDVDDLQGIVQDQPAAWAASLGCDRR